MNTGITIITLLTSSIITVSCHAGETNQSQSIAGDRDTVFIIEEQNGPLYIENPEIPEKMTFANQEISFDRVDMYERIDRELTSMTFTHGNTLLLLKRANKYFPIIAPILEKNGVPFDLIYLACVESTLNQRAYSPAKAAGIWQFIPSTAKQYGLEVNEWVDERYNIEKETEAACKYLKKAYDMYGNWESAAASYNGGTNRITSELDAQLSESAFDLYLVDETSRYMFRILATKLILENPAKYGYNVKPEQLYAPVDYDTVTVSTAIEDWAVWAREHGLSYSQLREANPWIRAKSMPNRTGKTYRVKIPKKDSLYRSKSKREVFNKSTK